MIHRTVSIVTLLFLMVVACNNAEEAMAPAATATLSAVTATSEAVEHVDEQDQQFQPTATKTATAESELLAATAPATLSPIRATQQALADAVRVPTRAATSVPIAADDYVALVDQACHIVQENYVRGDYNGVDWLSQCEAYRQRAEEVEAQEAYWELMAAFIAELDDEHSRFVPPGQFAAEFSLPSEGVGRPWPGFRVWPAREDLHLVIWDVCQSGPTAQAGLQRGDVIVAIDGQEIREDLMSLDVNALLYAEGKMEVELTVQQGPGASPRNLSVTYGGASGCDGWRYGLLSERPRIGYVRIPSFSGDASANVFELITLLEEETPLDGLVLDVRHNPGGNADQSIALFTTGTFGMTGPIREDASQGIYRIRGPVRWNESTPIVVLIDGASHSAAEYFATAMQQSGRATLVGMPTAGNTEGITGFNLADGSLIRLAFTTLQLPDGSTLEGVGVQPDVVVPLGDWGLRQYPDAQLQAAYDVLVDG